MKNLSILATLSAFILFPASSIAATWKHLEIHRFQDWDATYNEYTSQNGFFCAAETHNSSGDVFRLNFFRNGATHFLEVFNPNWNFFEGDVNFKLKFDNGYGAELKGTSWGDALTYDFIDKDYTFAIFGMLSKASRVDVLNSNNGVVGSFSLKGSKAAINELYACFTSEQK